MDVPVSFSESELSPVEVAATSNWPVMSVADFFTQVNWYGKPQSMTELSQPVRECSLSMPVAEFVAAIVWEGQPAIAALPVSAPLPITPSREITLADLSELF